MGGVGATSAECPCIAAQSARNRAERRRSICPRHYTRQRRANGAYGARAYGPADQEDAENWWRNARNLVAPTEVGYALSNVFTVAMNVSGANGFCRNSTRPGARSSSRSR